MTFGVQNSDGSTNIDLGTEGFGVYSKEGHLRGTEDSNLGAYAKDGSLRVAINSSGFGAKDASGALRVSTAEGTTAYDKTGALRIKEYIPWVPMPNGLLPNEYADFANNKYYANGHIYDNVDDYRIATGFTFTRASSAMRVKANKDYETVGSNVLRFDHNLATGDPLGILLEGTRTLQGTNNKFVGGVAGVIGAGGVLPDGWGLSDSDGITKTLSFSVTRGVPSMRIRFTGVPTTTAARALTAPNAVAREVGQTWSQGILASTVAGSLTNIAGILLRTGSGGSGSTTSMNNIASATKLYTNIQGTPETPVYTGTNLAIRWNYADTSTAIDWTLQVALASSELAPYASSPLMTESDSVTRASDVFSRTRPSPTELSGLITGFIPNGYGSTAQTLWQNIATTGNYTNLTRASNGTSLGIASYVSGVESGRIDLTCPPSGAYFKLAFRISNTELALSLNGSAVTKSAASLATGRTLEFLGRASTGSFWDGCISQKSEWTDTLLSDVNLQTLSTL